MIGSCICEPSDPAGDPQCPVHWERVAGFHDGQRHATEAYIRAVNQRILFYQSRVAALKSKRDQVGSLTLAEGILDGYESAREILRAGLRELERLGY